MVQPLGLQLLRLLPLVSSTVNLQLANDEWQVLTPWTELSAAQKPRAREVLPSWSAGWQSRALWQALIGLSTPIMAGIVNHVLARPDNAMSIFRDPTLSGRNGPSISAARRYLLGSIFSMAHFAFGSVALRLLAQMAADDVKSRESNIESVAAWLRMHKLRTITTDVPAFVCFVMATLQQMS